MFRAIRNRVKNNYNSFKKALNSNKRDSSKNKQNSRRLKSSKGFTQDWLTWQEYQQSYPCRWYPAYPPEPIHWHEPKYFGKQKAEFEWQLVKSFPELGILELSDGYVIGKDAWIVGQDNYLLPQFSTLGCNVGNININLPSSYPPLKSLKGSCLSLVSTWPDNYCHFLLDSLCRFHLFQRAGFSLDSVDFVYCPLPRSAHAKMLLEKLEIPESKQILLEDGIGIQAETLLIPSFPGVRRNYPPWVVEFLQDLVGFPQAQPYRRLYVTRGSSTRKLLNEAALMTILEPYGFEFYDPAVHPNQALDFNQAEVIIGPHGAAFANLAFCQAGTRFLELIPTDHVFTHFYTLAQSACLDYAYLMGQSTQEREWYTAPSPYDFSVNPQEFSDALCQFIV
jgi:hypothetical protein